LESDILMTERPTSKDPRLGPGSLYAALPIPACKTLTYAGKGQARAVLLALVMHSDGRNPYVFPSREVLERFSGVGSNYITEAIKTLVRFGFIEVTKVKQGRTYRNQYQILRACFHWSEFNDVANRYKLPRGGCQSCRHLVYGDEWTRSKGIVNGVEVLVRYHRNCGGRIKNLTKAQAKDFWNIENPPG
jgi:hypothetical protein